MGWAKYQEDDVSRYWRDAKTQVRMGRMANEQQGRDGSNDVGTLKQLRRRLAEDPADWQA